MELVEVKKDKTGHGLLIEHDAGRIIGKDDSIMQINEDLSSGKEFAIPDHFVVSAVFQKYGIKNANGRIYPEKILKREVENYVNNKIKTKTSIGALDHPSSTTLSGHDVSHKILNLEWQGCTLLGELELQLSPGYRKYGICSTSGDLVANLLISDIMVGVSSRAVGSVENVLGSLMVGDDLELIGWDVVCEPSTPNAWIKYDRGELQPFIENDGTKEGKQVVNEKIARIRKILL